MTRSCAALWLMLGAALLSSCGPGAPQTPATNARNIHALFVGIDDYQFSRAQLSRDQLSGSEFDDLKGAVGDAQRFKQAIAELYAVDVDKPSDTGCESANDQSVTLINKCATRSRILAALDQQIDALEPGDTLLFYFAGHGARYSDDVRFDQDTGYNGTILPFDARNPDGSPGDILDIELKAVKDRATAKGLYFVSIFDSCNSATATRSGAIGQSRNAPPLVGAKPPALPAAPPAKPGSGYWVHMAAAQDGEVAQETNSGTIGKRAGVFTTALIDTLNVPGMRDATFGDIIKEVQVRVAQNGHSAQNPSAEGDLTAAFGARAHSTILFDAAAEDGNITLKAGATSGITPGSTFAFYATQADALGKARQLATGSVVSVGPSSAQIAANLAQGATLPATMVAQETAHFVPANAVGVSNQIPSGAVRDAANAALAGIPFAALRENGAVYLALADTPLGSIALRAADGTLLADTPSNPGDPAFGEWLEGELKKVARVQQLLALRTTMQSDAGADDTGNVSFCIGITGYRPTACPPIQGGGVRKIDMGKLASATVINKGREPVYIYVLAIDPRNAVDLILPNPGEFDQKIRRGLPYRRERLVGFDTPGTYRFITITTDQPIRADAFNQSGNGTRDIAACRSPLERLLCSASEGTRDPGVTSIGNWSASVSSAIIVK